MIYILGQSLHVLKVVKCVNLILEHNGAVEELFDNCSYTYLLIHVQYTIKIYFTGSTRSDGKNMMMKSRVMLYLIKIICACTCSVNRR